jgi:C4-dicarboxylate transporter DctM subunit
MGGELIAVILLILVLIFGGVAVPFSFLAGCIVFCLWTGSSTGNFVQTSFTALNSYSIIAMPMFMIAGTLIDRSGIAATLVTAARGGEGAVREVCDFILAAQEKDASLLGRWLPADRRSDCHAPGRV